jgi:hypothetical protein
MAVFHGGREEKDRGGWEWRRFWDLKKGVGRERAAGQMEEARHGRSWPYGACPPRRPHHGMSASDPSVGIQKTINLKK